MKETAQESQNFTTKHRDFTLIQPKGKKNAYILSGATRLGMNVMEIVADKHGVIKVVSHVRLRTIKPR